MNPNAASKLTAARAEVREVRRAAREALSLRAEVGRLKRLLAAAGVDARKRSTIVSLRLEVETRRTRIGELEAELAKLRASRAVHQGAVRAQERAPGAGGVGPSARPPGRRRRPWPHAQAGSRKARGSSQPRGGRARLLRLRETVCGERLRHVGTDRGVGQGAHAGDRAPALAPRLRLRRRAAGSLGAAGGAAVREHALRDQRVGAVPVRAPCVSSAPQPGRRLADRPGAGDLGGDAGRRRAAPRAG